MLAIFENCSGTNDGKKSKILPISCKLNSSLAYDKIYDYLTKEEYADISGTKEFMDIYCYDRGYEISILLGIDQTGGSYINIVVYGPKKRGRTRKRLKLMRDEITNLLKDYLV